jgi:hypothetical protein
MDVYLEVGKKRTFACAVEWPGWARGGRSEAEALEQLLVYGDRYRAALGELAAGLIVPAKRTALAVVERGFAGRRATRCDARAGTCSTTPGRSRTDSQLPERRSRTSRMAKSRKSRLAGRSARRRMK